jgi:hypothetical protein
MIPSRPNPGGKPGVKPHKGPREPKLTQRVVDPASAWQEQEVAWYGEQNRTM